MRNSVILLVLGVLLLLVSLAADAIGLGPSPGLGWKQILGAVIGVVVAAIGLYGMRRS